MEASIDARARPAPLRVALAALAIGVVAPWRSAAVRLDDAQRRALERVAADPAALGWVEEDDVVRAMSDRVTDIERASERVLLLRVMGRNFVAGAIWCKTDMGWQCTRAASILGWMRGKRAEGVAAYMERRGWTWKWM